MQILRSRVAELKEAGGQSPELEEAELVVDAIAKETIDEIHDQFGINCDIKLSDNPCVIADEARLKVLAALRNLND